MRSFSGLHAVPVAFPAITLLVFMSWPRPGWAAEAPDAPAPAESRGVVPVPLPEGAPSLRMSSDYAHPALGFGTYTPLEQIPIRAIRVEPFTIRAAMAASMGYDDNVALSPTNKVSSMFYSVSPSVSLGLEGATQRYYAVYRGNYGAYSSSAQSDYADHELALAAANDWTTRLRTRLGYDFINGHTPRGITSNSTSADRWTYQSVHGQVQYGAPGAQGGLEGRVRQSSVRYSTANAAPSAEYDRTDLDGTFYYRLGPKTRALVGSGWSDITHPGDATLDNHESRVEVGAVWNALATTTGTLRVGYMSKNFSAAARPDFSGFSLEALGTWTPVPYSSVELSARRFLTESYELGSTFVVNTAATATWNHLWSGGVASTLNYAYGKLEQQGISRVDTYQSYRARVSYPVSRWLRAGAELRHESRDSDLPTLEYTRNIILLTAETAL